MLTVADRGRGGKICQNLADVICERSLICIQYKILSIFGKISIFGKYQYLENINIWKISIFELFLPWNI